MSGFADLHFTQSAHLALARAVDVAQTEVEASYPEAFSIEDRRLRFSIEATLGAADLDAFRRLLVALVQDAVTGEATFQAEGEETIVLRAGETSEAHRLGPMASGAVEIDLDVDESETRPTIRTEAG